MIFDRLLLWRDPLPRSGPENMAVDEWLLETVTEPVLRIYEWEGEWVSVGYFITMQEARSTLQGARVVRRATGGGIVDHRIDRTYTLMVPKGGALAQVRGAESYRFIHGALAEALRESGVDATMVSRDSEVDSPNCFEKPVAWDVVDGSGRKLAGAGQRRTRRGLLHQGSVVAPEAGEGLFERLAESLAGTVEEGAFAPDDDALAKGLARLASPAWLARR